MVYELIVVRVVFKIFKHMRLNCTYLHSFIYVLTYVCILIRLKLGINYFTPTKSEQEILMKKIHIFI